MHVLLVVLGSGGDVYPLIALGKALLARGHQVELVSSPHFASTAEAAGLSFHACISQDEESASLRNPNLWKGGGGFRVLFDALLDAVPETYRIITRRFTPGRTVLLANAAALGARVARETLGGPLLTVHLQPVLLRSRFHQPGLMPSRGWRPVVAAARSVLLPALDRLVFDPVLAPRLNAFRSHLGLAPVRRFFDAWIHSPDGVLGLFPEWFVQPEADWPPQTRLVGFVPVDPVTPPDEDRELDEFLDDGPPPVVFTLGTARVSGRPLFEASIEACQLSGRRGLLMTPNDDQVPPLPVGVGHFRSADFNRLLPRAAGLVHHGGMGTIAAAMTAGIPQIAVPCGFDQPDNAVRMQALGVGAVIRPRHYNGPTVARTLEPLLTSPAVLAKCGEIAGAQRAARPIARACDVIEATQHASTHPATPSGR